MTLLLDYVSPWKIFKARRGNECCFFHKHDMFSSGTTRLLVRSLFQNLPQMGRIITTTCSCHCMTPCQVLVTLDKFWIYRNLKTKFLNVCGWATMPRCLKFIPSSRMAPKLGPKDTWFSTHFCALEHVHVPHIRIMHIKCLENSANL